MKRLTELLGINTRIWSQAAWPFQAVSSPEPSAADYITMLQNHVYVCLCVSCVCFGDNLKGVRACSVVSDSLQPLGLKPTGLLCPWNSPGNKTGVGCHFLLQGIFPTQGWNHHLFISCIDNGVLPLAQPGKPSVQFSSIQLLSRVRLFATPWIAAHQPSLSITNSRSLPNLKSIKSVMPSSHLILCRPLLLLPPTPPSIRVFSNESTLRMRWPNIGVLTSASVLPVNTQDWSPLGWTGWISFQSKGLSRIFSNTTVQKHQFFGAQLFSQSNSHIHTWPLEKP